MDKSCESCLIPLRLDHFGGGTEKDGSKSKVYCSYCYQNGEFCHNVTLEEFQKICYELMIRKGVNLIRAKFLAMIIASAPRWKKTYI